ncbi:PREDICTED: uncharacterized protein LOC107187786 [Dufourea novaeangliae]|uniref:uncharacterized protein LOC107187786 n=1 Tax=Dufourea novaeangliae TaxID=178035 RepID=UPI000767447B|nr:PREDICTED: uncharacterized protein LOC107187786 [Dufourea novaeangliae]
MLYRSASSRRGRTTTPVAGPRGRRASVATDRPIDLSQTSPRGTMERLRSPRNSVVPDIALDVETDFDQGVTLRMLPDRDHYGESQVILNMSRSPRNSLLPDDYYRSPRNGVRSPRNSLVPEISPSRETYGWRQSLVPDVALSPRNSLIPDVVHNRSPRNSLVPLNGSRTSLMSDNDNPVSCRSPRHSLVPNSSRSPRGSITNMELIDRSPQRSPRGSIASDYLNESPRNSMVPYEPGRTSRGSIGVNDAHRGSMGANEVIDRTPRGSLGGLPERRVTKTSLMAHNPRRASADHGITNSRNSSPYREKEINSRNVRSGGSTVQMNLGYGPNAFVDSRRASSSVSQFSGDESRRLFHSSVKEPEDKMDNGNLTGVTYGSVVFQLKDANLEANSTCDFVFRGLKVVSKTRVVTVYLMLLSTIPVLMLIFGWKYSRHCPQEDGIPIYMIIGGTLGSIFMFLVTYSQIRSRRLEILTVPPPVPQISFVKLITVVLSCFLAVWFAMGNYWILHIMWPLHEAQIYNPDMFCDKTLYIFSMVHLGVIHMTFAITVFVMLVLTSFRILGWPLPERYR